MCDRDFFHFFFGSSEKKVKKSEKKVKKNVCDRGLRQSFEAGWVKVYLRITCRPLHWTCCVGRATSMCPGAENGS